MARPPQRTVGNHDLVGNLNISKLSNEEKLEITIKILKKESTERSSKEIEFLKRSTEDIKFFKDTVANLGLNTHDLLCQFMNHEHVRKDQILFEAGSIGTTFYIILKGKVGIIVKLPKPGKNELEPTEVAQLPAGASFGELSLLEAQPKPRAATILCKEECDFAVLDKKHYQEILGITEKKKLDLQIDFLLGLDIFRDVGWSRHAMKPVIKLFSQHVFPKGHYVYKEGQSSENIMAIKTGEIKFTKQITIKPKEPSEQVILDENSHVYSYQKLAVKRNVELAVMGPNLLFGDDETYLNIPRQSSAIVNSLEAEIWIIPRREFLKKLQTFDESYRVFVQQAKDKKAWRDIRIKEIIQIANEKIDPDLFVGASNNKSSQYSQVENRIKQRMYSVRQKQEQIIYQRNQIQELSQTPPLPANNKLAIQSGGSNVQKSHSPQLQTTANTTFSSIFYHNENNNSDLKLFLNSKWKVPSSEENKSIILYTANSTFRPVTEDNSRINTQQDPLNLTTYQAFAGSFHQLTTNDTSILNEQKTSKQQEQSKSTLLIENPNLPSQLPKKWNLNITYDELGFKDPGVEEQELNNQIPTEQSVNRRSRISKVNQRKYFYDAETMMNHTIKAKKKIQQELQEQSFVKNAEMKMYDFEEMTNKSKKSKAIKKQKEIRAKSTGPSRPMTTFEDKRKSDEYETQAEERNAQSLMRKKISTRDDDRTHEIGNWSTLMSFLPQRVKLNVDNVKLHPSDNENIQTTNFTTNKITTTTTAGENASRTILLEGQKQIEASLNKPKDGDHSRLNISHYESRTESRNRTPPRKIHVVGSGFPDQNKTRILEASPEDKRSFSVREGRRLHDRLHSRNDSDRNRLFEYNIIQKYQRKKFVVMNGQKIASKFVDEQEKEKLLRTYEKFKNLKLKNIYSKMK